MATIGTHTVIARSRSTLYHFEACHFEAKDRRVFVFGYIIWSTLCVLGGWNFVMDTALHAAGPGYLNGCWLQTPVEMPSHPHAAAKVLMVLAPALLGTP